MQTRIIFSIIFFITSVIVTNGQSDENINFNFTETSGKEKLELMQKAAMDIVAQQPDKADSIAQMILDLTDKTQLRFKGLAYYILGEVEYYREHYELALKHYKKAEPYLETTKDSAKMAGVYSNIGLMYLYKANYTRSLSYYEKSFSIEKQQNDYLGMAKSLQNMGLIFGHWEKFELQNSYYKQAIDLYTKLNDQRSVADMALNLGVSLVFQNKLQEGHIYYQKALETYENLRDSDRIASVITNIGYYHIKVKEYDEASTYLNKAIQIFTLLNKKVGLINAYTGLGDLYVAQNKRIKAVEMYKTCESINKEVGLLDIQGDNLLSLYEAYKTMGNESNALRVYEQYHTIKDSIYNIDKLDKILELENRYKFQRSQNQVTELKAQNRLYTIFFLLAIFIIICAGVFMFFYNKHRGMKEKQRLLTLEQKVLRTQMNPHFIFNSLSAIQCYILENKIMDAVDFLADFASLIRMVLHYSKEEFINLEQEKEILDFYIDLQNKRFGDKVTYEIIIDEELENAKIMIPPMLAQPFIENSFEHGELCKKDDGHISVRFMKKGKNLTYQIEDNGIGISSKHDKSNSPTSKKHKSLALKITKERLKLINNSNLGTRVDLLIEDRSKYGEQGTRVEFTIPLKENA